MTIRILENRFVWSANGTTTDFTWTTQITRKESVQVWLKDAEGVESIVADTEYSVEFNKTALTIKFNTAPADNSKVGVLRNTPYANFLDIQNGQRFDTNLIGRGLDYSAEQAGQLIGNVPRFSPFFEGEVEGINLLEGEFLYFDGTSLVGFHIGDHLESTTISAEDFATYTANIAQQLSVITGDISANDAELDAIRTKASLTDDALEAVKASVLALQEAQASNATDAELDALRDALTAEIQALTIADNPITDVSYDEATHIFTFTFDDGTTKTATISAGGDDVDYSITNFHYNPANGNVVFTQNAEAQDISLPLIFGGSLTINEERTEANLVLRAFGGTEEDGSDSNDITINVNGLLITSTSDNGNSNSGNDDGLTLDDVNAGFVESMMFIPAFTRQDITALSFTTSQSGAWSSAQALLSTNQIHLQTTSDYVVSARLRLSETTAGDGYAPQYQYQITISNYATGWRDLTNDGVIDFVIGHNEISDSAVASAVVIEVRGRRLGDASGSNSAVWTLEALSINTTGIFVKRIVDIIKDNSGLGGLVVFDDTGQKQSVLEVVQNFNLVDDERFSVIGTETTATFTTEANINPYIQIGNNLPVAGQRYITGSGGGSFTFDVSTDWTQGESITLLHRQVIHTTDLHKRVGVAEDNIAKLEAYVPAIENNSQAVQDLQRGQKSIISRLASISGVLQGETITIAGDDLAFETEYNLRDIPHAELSGAVVLTYTEADTIITHDEEVHIHEHNGASDIITIPLGSNGHVQNITEDLDRNVPSEGVIINIRIREYENGRLYIDQTETWNGIGTSQTFALVIGNGSNELSFERTSAGVIELHDNNTGADTLTEANGHIELEMTWQRQQSTTIAGDTITQTTPKEHYLIPSDFMWQYGNSRFANIGSSGVIEQWQLEHFGLPTGATNISQTWAGLFYIHGVSLGGGGAVSFTKGIEAQVGTDGLPTGAVGLQDGIYREVVVPRGSANGRLISGRLSRMVYRFGFVIEGQYTFVNQNVVGLVLDVGASSSPESDYRGQIVRLYFDAYTPDTDFNNTNIFTGENAGSDRGWIVNLSSSQIIFDSIQESLYYKVIAEIIQPQTS